MQVKVESCTREVKTIQSGQRRGQVFTGIKINGSWVNVVGDHRKLYGKTIELSEIKHTQAGDWAEVLSFVSQPQSQTQGPSGAITCIAAKADLPLTP